uniref:Uncharacterized protein n=1 Tax=Globodera rostochiensis TaxID=31243 RepID=A0A914HFL6_GLORO
MGQKCTTSVQLIAVAVVLTTFLLMSEFTSTAIALPSAPREFSVTENSDHRRKRLLLLHPAVMSGRSLEKLVEHIVASGYDPDGIAIRPGK